MKTTVKIPQPLGDRLLARPVAPETKSAGGILLPEQAAKEKRGELADVLAVGPAVDEVKVGDRIVYAKYAADNHKHQGEELLILHEEDCLATVPK